MKNLIYILLIVFSLSSCKKEKVETIESLKGSYTYDYSFTNVINEYDMNTGTYGFKNETGTDSRQIEIISSPNSDKELIIVNLQDQDETTIYFSDGMNSFVILNNSGQNVDAAGKGEKIGEELHFNVNFDSPFISNKFKGVAKRN